MITIDPLKHRLSLFACAQDQRQFIDSNKSKPKNSRLIKKYKTTKIIVSVN